MVQIPLNLDIVVPHWAGTGVADIEEGSIYTITSTTNVNTKV